MKAKIYLVVGRSWNEFAVLAAFLSKDAVDAALPKIKEDNKAFDSVEIEEWEDGEVQ